MPEITCLLWFKACSDPNIIPTLYNGWLLTFYELLSLLGIIFAWIQFLYGDMLRRLLFFRYKFAFTFFISLSVAFLSIGYIAPLIPWEAIFFIGYPYFWELLALMTITWITLFLLLFSLYHNSNLWIIKYSSHRKAHHINEIARFAIYTEWNDDSYRALSRILDYNLKIICETLSLYDQDNIRIQLRHHGKEVNLSQVEKEEIVKNTLWANVSKYELINDSRELFNQILPDVWYCTYLVERDYNLLYNIYEAAEKYKLWNSIWPDLFQTLSTLLFWNPKSLIQKELANNGIYKNKWLFKLLTTSSGILGNFDILDSDFEINEWNKKLIVRLSESALSFYFSSEENQTEEIKYRLKHLMNKLLNPYKYLQNINEFDIELKMFIENIPRILIFWSVYWEKNTNMYFSENEKNIVWWSVLDEITDLLFQRFELIMQMDEDKWYMHSQPYWWIIWPNSSTDTDWDSKIVLNNIRARFLEKIIERIQRERMHWFGDKNHIIKLLLTIFWWKINQSYFKEDAQIPRWVENQFNTEWANNFITDEDFKKWRLPKGLAVEDGKILDIGHAWKTQLFPVINSST